MSNSTHDNDEFVRVDGQNFYLGDKPYRYVGANMWYGAYLGSPGETGDRERLTRELDVLLEHGITNLRILAASETSDLMRAVRPAVVKNTQGDLDSELLLGLDFLLAEMAKRDMKAVLYLNNFWQWSGGMSQYVAWFTGTEVLDPDVTGKWNPFMENSARFYRIEQAQQLYRKVIRSVITRTNSITGMPYNDDPTIMSWQLANEPRPGSDADGRVNFEAFERWVDVTAGYVKSLAPRQLVSTGNEGAMGTLGDAELFERSHSSPNIDYLTFHMWIKNWNWFDITKPEATYDSAVATAKHYMSQHVEIAQRLGKPIVLEEFGVERDNGVFDHKTPVAYRDRFYAMVYSVIEDNTAAGGPFVGSNFWAWGGFGKTDRADYMWQKGDDFFGDPPQEAQGLNSVFSDDETTLKVIAKHAERLQAL
ncbi:glycoside hydrolase 5 family protein [Gilvimarinus polysaccharolyticus]|uniref:glycoside hydrolase 5 family protein n=1 Tax=Gilvimarinus polysaccharolyticus TaxID=863921 RepID=UPI001E5A61B3|nr:mannanase [Gilvimarinus polysaccharolyticus]